MPEENISDLRAPSHRDACLRGPVGDFERVAAVVLSRALGAHVTLQDDGRATSMPDLRLEYCDGRRAVAEVVTDQNPATAAVLRELRRGRNQIPLELALSGLANDWFLTAGQGWRRRGFAERIAVTLQQLEAAGRLFPSHTELDDQDACTADLLVLGVVEVASRPAQQPTAMVRVYPSGVTGPPLAAGPQWESLVDWLEHALQRPAWADVRSKLAAADGVERHVVVGLTFSTPGDVYFSLDRYFGDLPSRTPSLPAEITHVWVTTTHADSRCLGWSAGLGWVDATRLWTARGEESSPGGH